jgi:hypothetical protein
VLQESGVSTSATLATTPSNVVPPAVLSDTDTDTIKSASNSDLTTNATENSPVSTRQGGLFPAQLDPFGDRTRTEKRYKNAAKELAASLDLRRANWESFEVPKFGNISEDDPIPQLREQIQVTLEARKNTVNDKGVWSSAKNAIEKTFTAISPFAKNFLKIAKEGQSVIFLVSSFCLLCVRYRF